MVWHLVRRVAPELFSGRSPQDLKNVRNDIAHVRRVVDKNRTVTGVRAEAASLTDDLMLSLVTAILTLASPSGAEPGSVTAALPRHYETRPNYMILLTFDTELTTHRPWFGDWVEVVLEFEEMRSEIEATGRYVPGYPLHVRISAELAGNSVGTEPKVDWRLVVFEDKDTNVYQEYGPDVEQREWRARVVSPAWQRVLQANRRRGTAQE